MILRVFCLVAFTLAVRLSADSSAYLSSYYYNLQPVSPKETRPPPQSDQSSAPPRRCSDDQGIDEPQRGPRCCCESCCSREKCCYEARYSPYYNQLRCNCGGNASIEFLYWYAQETNLSYAMKVAEQPLTSNSSTLLFGAKKAEYLKSSWDPGVRLSLGFDSDCNEYDVAITWTWMKNNSFDSSSVDPFPFETVQQTDETFLISPWINQSLQLGSVTIFSDISATWELTYNQVDFEIGRKYCTGPYFTIRPFAGVRAAFWETNFNVCSSRKGIQVVGEALGRDLFENNAWGVGLVGGVEPAWYFCRGIALYGEFDVALLWGSHTGKKKEELLVVQNSTGQVNVDYENSFIGTCSQMTPQIDVGIGLRYECTWCNCRYRSTFDIGWEHHVLFDQNHRIKGIDNFMSNSAISGFRSYVESSGNIGLGGLIIRARLDF